MIYMDHAATTYLKDEVAAAMSPYFKDIFGNASSTYSLGRAAREAVENARTRMAALMGAKANEVFFTSGGSESDNWAIKGAAFANMRRGRHIITTKVEHNAVLETCRWLEKMRFRVTYLNVDRYGMVDLNEVKRAVQKDTILISVMYANNEIGTINPIEQIGRFAHEKGIYFHTDAVQAAGQMKIDAKRLGADMISISAHKLYGPKGVGALYIQEGTQVANFVHGGGQEMKRRAGTENVPGIVGMAKALEIANRDMAIENGRIEKIRSRMTMRIREGIDGVRFNGHPTLRLPNNLNVSIDGINAIECMRELDKLGVACSGGSACSAGNPEPSHVLLATGLSEVQSKSALRFTFGASNTLEQAEIAAGKLKNVVEKLRKK